MKNYTLVIQGLQGLLAESYLNEDKKTTTKIFNLLKENSELFKLFTIVTNLRNGRVSEESVDGFINENVQFAKNINYKSIKYPFSKEIKSDESFFNEIGTVLFEEKTPFNLEKYTNAYQSVRNHLLSLNKSDEKIFSMAKSVNENLSKIDAEDKVLVESFIKAPLEDKSMLFESTKKSCLEIISEHVSQVDDIQTKVKMYEVKDKILTMEFNSKTYIQDIVKIHNLSKDLK